MRLTKKELMSAVNQPMCFGSRLVGKKMFAQIIKELCEYKTIEDELGIDLITLFKALKQRLAYMFVQNDYNENYKKGLIKPLIVSNFYKYGEDYKLVLCDSLTCLSYYVSVKDYGKTWALTKEELE